MFTRQTDRQLPSREATSPFFSVNAFRLVSFILGGTFRVEALKLCRKCEKLSRNVLSSLRNLSQTLPCPSHPCLFLFLFCVYLQNFSCFSTLVYNQFGIVLHFMTNNVTAPSC